MTGKTATLFSAIQKNSEIERLDIHTALPARVASFNQDANTVTAEVMINQTLKNGKDVALPPLVDVPVQFPRGGGFVLTFPIVAGDEGLIVFAERCIDGWFVSGEKSPSLDARMHDYSDGIFIPGISSLPNTVKHLFNEGASLQTLDGETYIRLVNGEIHIKGNIVHDGDTTQNGDYNQKGSFNQTGGSSLSEGAFTATTIKTSAGVELGSHTHPDTHGGNTGAPNQ